MKLNLMEKSIVGLILCIGMLITTCFSACSSSTNNGMNQVQTLEESSTSQNDEQTISKPTALSESHQITGDETSGNIQSNQNIKTEENNSNIDKFDADAAGADNNMDNNIEDTQPQENDEHYVEDSVLISNGTHETDMTSNEKLEPFIEFTNHNDRIFMNLEAWYGYIPTDKIAKVKRRIMEYFNTGDIIIASFTYAEGLGFDVSFGNPNTKTYKMESSDDWETVDIVEMPPGTHSTNLQDVSYNNGNFIVAN